MLLQNMVLELSAKKIEKILCSNVKLILKSSQYSLELLNTSIQSHKTITIQVTHMCINKKHITNEQRYIKLTMFSYLCNKTLPAREYNHITGLKKWTK